MRQPTQSAPWGSGFDPDNVGREGDWHQGDVFSGGNDRRDIEVPCCWEEIEQDYEGVAFYRCKFQVPTSWDGKTVRPRFDAVNYLTENFFDFDVFTKHDLAVPSERIAVLDVNGPFTRFLRANGIHALEFDASTPRSTPVFVTSVIPRTPTGQKRSTS